jgi:hypothetical protein
MPDFGMAAQTIHRLLRASAVIDKGSHRSMTEHAVLLGNIAVHGRDTYGFGEVPCGEGQAVVKAIDGFDSVFGHETIVWGVTIVAHRNGLVTAVIPGRVNIAHNVAVGAGFGVIGQVGRSLSVQEGKPAKGDQAAQQAAQKYPEGRSAQVAVGFL